MQDKILVADDLCEILKCGADTAYNLLRRQDFPSFRIGNRYYILESKLFDWFAKQNK